jgi:toxin ParE1/3/4
MSYRILPKAEQDIEAIADYIAGHNPRAALKLLDLFDQRWSLLSDFPETGQRRTDLDAEARHVVISHYLTLYRVRQGGVEIVRVLHGKRKITPDDFD